MTATNKPLFSQVTLIGIGLIGSSIARALREYYLAETIVVGDANPNHCAKALELGLCDRAETDLADSVKGSDLVILCVPVRAMAAVAEQIGPALSETTILTDVGSVKQTVINDVLPFLPNSKRFVGGHPIAGTEQSGPEAGFYELFHGRYCILTPLAGTDETAVEAVAAMWKSFGSKIERMEPTHHDKVLGITSHLPHLIAYTIVGTAADLEDDLQSEVIRFSASGFRDFTRIAGSDPTMWRDIFLNNKDAVLDIIQRFSEDLTMLQKAIRKGDGDTLHEHFTRTRAIQRGVVAANQQGTAIWKPKQED